MLFELYKAWIAVCTAVGCIIGFFSPWFIAAWIVWKALNAGT